LYKKKKKNNQVQVISFVLDIHRDDLAIMMSLYAAGHVEDINKMYDHLYALS